MSELKALIPTGVFPSLIALNGKMDENNPLFRCTMGDLAAHIRLLLNDHLVAKAALCQRLAVAKMRHENGDCGNIPWRRWCEANVRKPDGRPYSPQTIYAFTRIGRSADVTAAWDAYRTHTGIHHDRTNSKRMAEIARKLGPAFIEKTLALPLAPARKGLRWDCKSGPHARAAADAAREFNALMTAWDVASEQARGMFLRAISAVLQVAPTRNGAERARVRADRIDAEA
jgi:hypothetical protein